MNKDDYWLNKEKRDIMISERITRHGSLNTAVEIIKASSMNTNTTETLHTAFTLAELIESFIKKNDT